MHGAHVDVEDLEQFQGLVRSSSANIQDIHVRLQFFLERMADDWRDSEYETFTSVFGSTEASLRMFVESSETYSQYLARLIRYLKEYVNLQPPAARVAEPSGTFVRAAGEQEDRCLSD